MNNGDMPANPVDFTYEQDVSDTCKTVHEMHTGLTKREEFAKAAMQGFLASYGQHDVEDFREIAADSVNAADALLAALEEGE